MNIKIEELLSALNRKEEEKEKNTVLWGGRGDPEGAPRR